MLRKRLENIHNRMPYTSLALSVQLTCTISTNSMYIMWKYKEKKKIIYLNNVFHLSIIKSNQMPRRKVLEDTYNRVSYIGLVPSTL